MSKKSKHKPKGPKSPPQNTQQKQPEVKEEISVEVKEQPVVQEQPDIKVQREAIIEKAPEAKQSKSEQPPPSEPKSQPEDKPIKSDEVPVKPKRNRGNRKKKQGDGSQESPEEDVPQSKPVEIPIKKEEVKVPEVIAPEKGKVSESKSDKVEVEKQESKSKKNNKKDNKNAAKGAPVVVAEEKKSQPEKVVAEIKDQPAVAGPEIAEQDNSASFVEAKGGKNKKGKNKKNKDNKETPTDDVISEIKEVVEVKEIKEVKKELVEKPAETVTPPIAEVLQSSVAEVEVHDNSQKNKKGKKGEQKQKQNKDTAVTQSKDQPKETTILKSEEKEVKAVEKKLEIIEKPKVVEVKPKFEVPPDITDDILPSLASSIEKTLEELIVCESDIVLSEQLKNEEEKKDKNKKKSKKDKEKHVEKTEPISETKEKAADVVQIEPQIPIVPNVPEIKPEIIAEDKSKTITRDIKIETPPVDAPKTPEVERKHLTVRESTPTSKSPTRKDRRKKSPKPPQKNEEKIEDVKQETTTKISEVASAIAPPKDEKSPVSVTAPQKDEKSVFLATAPQKDEKATAHVTIPQKDEKLEVPEDAKLCEKNKNKEKKGRSKDRSHVESKDDIKIVTCGVPDDIISALLLDTPPAFIQEAEASKSDVPILDTKHENVTVKYGVAATKACELSKSGSSQNIPQMQKSLPVELDSDAGSYQLESNVENEMKKALEVAIGVIVGSVPTIENIMAKESAIVKKQTIEKPTEEQKTSEKSDQNKQECKGKSKKNKNKHNQDEHIAVTEKEESSPKTEHEAVPKIEACPMKIDPIVESPIPIVAPSPPIEIQKPVVLPVVETPSIITPVVPVAAPFQKESIADTKPSEDTLKPADNIQQPASPKPQKRNKDKKGKHGKGSDEAKGAQTSSGQQQTEQKSTSTTESKSTSETDKKQSDSEKNKDEKKQTDGESAKKAQKDDASLPSDPVKPEFEFLPISDSCIKGSGSPAKQEAKDKSKRKSPPKNQPKNLLGPSNIPAKSNKYDYKKEKNKGEEDADLKCDAKVKLRTVDTHDLPECNEKIAKAGSLVMPGLEGPSGKKARCAITELEDGVFGDDEDEEFVYKYSFRTVFIANACHICKIGLKDDRVVCRFCHLVSYCGEKHRDDDWQTHQSLCYAICTISHTKEQNYIYGDSKSLNGHDYRLLRMQTIVSCEKMLKRKLCPWEQEALLYPRICTLPSCREWKSGLLKDCEGCGQVSYCSANPTHLPADHINWCRSYKLYYKLVSYQLNHGRLEPELPVKIPPIGYDLPEKCSILFEDLYGSTKTLEECHYATLTQLSTAPLTALYAYQKYTENNNVITNCTSKDVMVNGTDSASAKSSQSFCIHLIGAELQFEGDTLKKWETFFLHFMHNVKELNIVLIGPELNTSKLPVELLGRIKLCQCCRQADRKIKFDFIEGTLYHDYVESQKFIRPDIICAFNPGFHRATGYAGLDSWPETIASCIRLRVPICVTAYTAHEMPRDLERVRSCAPAADRLRIIIPPGHNPYCSLRPDRNFVSDDEMPLIFKNYHMMLVAG
ncbi:uncharacterized protein LOC143919842 isoform X2 [Arctopsyche grandis]|uniref:uncharacterized protein LOC143919842 isoform X2 n=1 Tax=Arctopsyche grandis TaxID=121162 RepID=UPI00406D64CA